MSRLTALTAAGALPTVPVVMIAARAPADVDRHGTCGGGQYDFPVDRENRGYEVDLDVDNVEPGSGWKSRHAPRWQPLLQAHAHRRLRG